MVALSKMQNYLKSKLLLAKIYIGIHIPRDWNEIQSKKIQAFSVDLVDIIV